MATFFDKQSGKAERTAGQIEQKKAGGQLVEAGACLKSAAVALLAMVALALSFSSCDQRAQHAEEQSVADSLLNEAMNVADYKRVLALCDSLEQTGDISPIRSAYLRGSVYSIQNNVRRSQEVLEMVMKMTPENREDSAYYIESVFRMAELRSMEKDFEGALRVALPVIEQQKGMKGAKESRVMGGLYSLVGYAQYNLGMKDDAAQSFDLCYDNFLKLYAADSTWKNIGNAAITAFNIVGQYQLDNDYANMEKWTLRHDSIFAIISAMDDLPAHFTDRIQSENALLHAHLALAQNRPDEAMRALDIYKKTEGAKTSFGKILIAGVLLKSGHYAEAADIYACADQYLEEQHMELSLDVIKELLGEKFTANYRSGRRDSALAVAAIIVESLDSAIKKQKDSDAAELATIYQTQQKDAEIAEQKISLSRQRSIGTMVALVLITTFFIIYTWYRRRAANRLGAALVQLQDAHFDLKEAYDQLEEATAARERIESELRIARDIQMSMVPGVFPERDGLDMYAEMNPAKEVGGDLYGYVLQGERLYFCLGDVSGKGVPASLFMAQSARLFRTLAAEGMMPADVAFRMNNALAENNDRGMFVTMFIGMLHLDTGRLDYCNCGHNPPVIDGQFLPLQYDNQPLGLWEDDPFEGESIADIRGKQILIYTDGLNEAENSRHELLGNARLLELMASTQSLDSRQVIAMLREAVEQHRAGAEPNDDLTLMCLRIG